MLDSMDSTVDVSEDGSQRSEGQVQDMTFINVSFEPALSVERGVTEGVLPMSPVSMVSAPASTCSPPADSPVSGSSSQEIEGSIIVSCYLVMFSYIEIIFTVMRIRYYTAVLAARGFIARLFSYRGNIQYLARGNLFGSPLTSPF